MIRVGGGGTSWSVTLGLAMVGVLAVAVLLGPLVAGDPFATDPALRLLPPSAAHWLGTDHLGLTSSPAWCMGRGPRWGRWRRLPCWCWGPGWSMW